MATISLMCSTLRVKLLMLRLQQRGFLVNAVGQFDDKAGDEFAFGVGGQESGEVGLMLLEQVAHLAESRNSDRGVSRG